ncbi:MAG TPA: TRAM domain-containing protein, partial [Aquaticitalea sp.]|nr:TRAM domain-containing protein [Aquaticitalea sp.]
MSRKKTTQIFENIEVLDAGAKGKSIAKAPDGRVIFLNNAVPGDVVDVQTFKKRKAYFEGKAIRFHQYSEQRTDPKCQHFGVCGGCKWQDMDYGYQLAHKQKEVENNLKRIGHLQLPETTPVLGSKNIYFYRNKMEYSFSDNRWLSQDEIGSGKDVGDRNALGFHIPGMWDKILDIKKCWL